MAHVKKHCTDVNTPDFAAEFMEIESESIQMKSSSFSRKGNPLCLTSAPTSLFNSPQELQYTQGLEQTLVHKYSAVKEVFNDLSGEKYRDSVRPMERAYHGKSVRHMERASRGASRTLRERPRNNYVVRKMMGRSKGRSFEKLR